MHALLTLIPSPPSGATVSAGWLPSAAPTEWLAEIARCQRQGIPVTGYLVARSLDDPRPAGIFLVPTGKSTPAFGPRVQPLKELLRGVHGPMDSRLSAALLPHEREFFFRHTIHFFHPVLGLTGFDERDRITPARLLQTQDSRPAAWNRAVPATGFDPQLRSLHVAEPPDPQEMMADSAGDIGSESLSPESDGLLDQAKTLGKGLAGGALLGVGGLLGGIGKILGPLGGGAKNGAEQPPGTLDQLQDWAKKNWKELADRRQREIDRLMKLLETDPDAGLRYALPLNGDASRGTAAPGSILGERSTIFSHGNGGRAADSWGLENQDRLKLERQYRQAAQREVELGRHDRAAYIYGNLLGDWTGAARVLVGGGRYQDALAIYLHKLDNRLAGARMLESAGLLLQAAVLYAELKQFEKAGDLHAQLGNDNQARAMWLAEVESRSDRLQKARLLSEKLGDHTSALALLNLSWLTHEQVPAAVDAMFAICRKQSDPAAALVLLKRIFEPGSAPVNTSAKLELAFQQIGKWPDEPLRRELERLACHHIAQAVAGGDGEAKRSLEFLNRLDPRDRLLQRDVRRASAGLAPITVAKSGPSRGSLQPKSIVTLQKGAAGFSLADLPYHVSAAGYQNGSLRNFRVGSRGVNTLTLALPDDPGPGPVAHLALTEGGVTRQIFHFRRSRRLHMQALDQPQTEAEHALGTLRAVLAICPLGRSEFLTLQFENTSSLTLHTYSSFGELRSSRPIELIDHRALGLDWHLAAQTGHLVISSGHILAWQVGESALSVAELPEEGRMLRTSPPGRPPEALLCTDHSITLFSPGKPAHPPEAVNLFTERDSMPVACYLASGDLVMVAGLEGQMFSSRDRIAACATFRLPGGKDVRAIDICPQDNGGFAVLLSDGRLALFD